MTTKIEALKEAEKRLRAVMDYMCDMDIDTVKEMPEENDIHTRTSSIAETIREVRTLIEADEER